MGERATSNHVPRKLRRAVWDKIRRRAETGETAASLAREFGTSAAAIYKRSAREQWQTPGREAKAGSGLVTRPVARAAETGLETRPVDNSACLPDLLAAIDSGDLGAMQAAMVRLGQGMLREGLAGMAPPSTAREFATWYDIVRKAAGIDGRNSAPTGPRLHAPRSIGRPAPLAPPAAPQEFEIE